MEKYILALDQGTTSSRAVVFDSNAAGVASAQEEFPQYYPNPGWVEHDPEDIFRSQLSVAKKAVASAGILPEQIAAVGITNQRETVVIWDRKSGIPVYNAIVWQCRRTASIADELILTGKSQIIRNCTGSGQETKVLFI